MGLYLRKSFRMGPLRFNLSKSGVGLSGGVKGARTGINSRGRRYVHAGRHGLYYRKSLSGQSATRRQTGDGGCRGLLVTLLVLSAGALLLFVMAEHPGFAVLLMLVSVGYFAVRFTLKARHRKRINACKRDLDRLLVDADTAPSPEQERQLADACATAGLSSELRRDIYQAVLDRVLDDQRITESEAERLRAAERILKVDKDGLRTMHRELFTAAWMEAVSDERISAEEVAHMLQLLDGLGIPRAEVREELETVNDLIEAQNLKFPLPEVGRGEHDPHLQQSETLYAAQSAQVLSRRGRGKTITWRVHREGTLLLTDKRILVVGGGTTQLRLDDISDVEIDLDEGLLILHKHGIGRPTWIRTWHPFLLGRRLEILREKL